MMKNKASSSAEADADANEINIFDKHITF